MTIITKPISEKKVEKLAPLVENDQLASAPPEDVESQSADNARFVILRARARRVSATTTLCLLLTALIVVAIGMLGGVYLYQQYLRAKPHRFTYNVPMKLDDAEQAMYVNSFLQHNLQLSDSGLFRTWRDNIEMNSNDYLPEKFDIDTVNYEYEKIDVPDFRDGRSGRFIHDFNTNMTGIIDVTGKRCFVMPLNRVNVLPPRSLFDLLHKMFDGYYKVDTETVRKTMKAVTPPITDTKGIGSYITNECVGLPIYKLEEKHPSHVEKRSAEAGNEIKFTQFSGNGIMEYEIDLDELSVPEDKPKK